MGRRRREEEIVRFFGKLKEAEVVKGRLPTSTSYVCIFFEQALYIFAFLWILFQKSIFAPCTVKNSKHISYLDFLKLVKNAFSSENYQNFQTRFSKFLFSARNVSDIEIGVGSLNLWCTKINVNTNYKTSKYFDDFF